MSMAAAGKSVGVAILLWVVASGQALAVENYEKSLSLDPKNSNAAARLKKLTEN
jgi:hypothetical protein